MGGGFGGGIGGVGGGEGGGEGGVEPPPRLPPKVSYLGVRAAGPELAAWALSNTPYSSRSKTAMMILGPSTLVIVRLVVGSLTSPSQKTNFQPGLATVVRVTISFMAKFWRPMPGVIWPAPMGLSSTRTA